MNIVSNISVFSVYLKYLTFKIKKWGGGRYKKEIYLVLELGEYSVSVMWGAMSAEG